MQYQSTLRLFVLGGVLALGCASMGCDSDNSKINTDNNNGQQADTGTQHDTADATESTPDVGQDSTEEKDVQFVPGVMNGAWKVTTTEDDAVVTYFDIVHNEGQPKVTGGYLTGVGLYEGFLEGGVGELDASSFDGTTLTIQWNPTTQDTEMLTLSATKVDDDTLDGRVTAVQNTQLDMAVIMTRDPDAPGH